MVVVDKLNKIVAFFPINSTHKATNIAKNFMRGIFKLHGMPMTIVSDRDSKFHFKFLESIFEGLGTKTEF
jgi:hypothetical protein